MKPQRQWGFFITALIALFCAAVLWRAFAATQNIPKGKYVEPSNSKEIEIRLGLPTALGYKFEYGDLNSSGTEQIFDHESLVHPRIKLIHGKHTFITPPVDYIRVSAVKNLGGVTDVDIYLHEPAYGSTHEQARDFVYGLIKQAQSAGWLRYVGVGLPCYKGESSLRAVFNEYYKLPNEVSAVFLDPDYLVPIKDLERENRHGPWSANFSWRLYVDGIVLEIGIFDTKFNEKDPSFNTYRVEMKFSSQESILRLNFDEKDRSRWRELWPEKIKEIDAERQEGEALARKHGLEIDETYQDPELAPPMAGRNADGTVPAPPEQRTSLRALPGEPCPRTGLWMAVALSGRGSTLVRRGEPMPGPVFTSVGSVIWQYVGDAPAA